jgi:hypothetical protein
MWALAMIIKPAFDAHGLFILWITVLLIFEITGICVVGHDFQMDPYLKLERKTRRLIKRAKSSFFVKKVKYKITLFSLKKRNFLTK